MNASTLGVIEREKDAITKGLIPAADFNMPKEAQTKPKTTGMFDAPNIIFDNLGEGEKFKDLSTARPNLNIPAFIREIMRPASSGKGVPHEVLEGGYDSNYSASRAAIQQFWKSIEVYRDSFISCLFVPLYEAYLDEFVANGDLKLKGYSNSKIKRQAWLQHDWIGSAQPTLDPNKDIKAVELAIELGLLTGTDAAMHLYGKRLDDNIEKRKEEVQKLNEIPSLNKTQEAQNQIISNNDGKQNDEEENEKEENESED